MECHYCHTSNRKFYCCRCLIEKLQNHHIDLDPLVADRDRLIKQATDYTTKTEAIRAVIAERNRCRVSIKNAQDERLRILRDSDAARQRIQKLRLEIQQRRSKMDNAEEQHSSKAMTNCAKDIQLTRRNWNENHRRTVAARKVLVRETISLFDFKPGVVEDRSGDMDQRGRQGGHKAPYEAATIKPLANSSNNSSMPFAVNDRYQHPEDLYICGVTLPARTIDASKYSKEELNAAIGYLTHMLGLIVRYLGIKLPYPIFHKAVHPYVRCGTGKQRNISKMPLFLDDKNFRRFTIGMAMLNYNIAYLCHTQGVEIPLPQVSNILQALMLCCQSPRIGIQSHITIAHGISNTDFLLDFPQVLRMTALRYRSGSYMTTELTKELVLNGLLNDGFFNSTPAAGRGYESESDWYFYDGLLDNDEDDIQDDEIEDRFDDDGESSENWHLVDVMPSFGRPNGEGESIFQLGATMMGMMESLGGRSMAGNTAGSTAADLTSSNVLATSTAIATTTTLPSSHQQNLTSSSEQASASSVYHARLNALKRHAGFPL